MANKRVWLNAAMPLALISGMQVVGNQSGLIILGLFRPEAEVGFYKVAVSASTLTLLGLQIAGLVIAPYIARMYALGETNRLQRLSTVGALGAATLTLPVILVFIFAGRWFITLLYGANYAEAYIPLLVLAAGQMLNACFGLNTTLLAMTGRERVAARW